MELRHLRYFVAVADCLSFGRAAAKLGIAQPSLSHQIQQLETELQARLLARTTRRVQLTQAGRLFLEEAREILAQVDRAALVARRASLGEVGALRVGCSSWMDAGRILTSLASFHQSNPAIQIDLQTVGVPQQVAALREERLDVGFVFLPVDEPSLTIEILLSEPFVVALPAGHRLGRRKRVDVADLANEDFVLLPRAAVPILHDLVLKLCREAGFVPKVPHEIDDPHMVLGLVAADAGVTLVPASVRSAPRGVMLRPLRPSPPILTTALASRREGAPPLVGAFIQATRPLWPRE